MKHDSQREAYRYLNRVSAGGQTGRASNRGTVVRICLREAQAKSPPNRGAGRGLPRVSGRNETWPERARPQSYSTVKQQSNRVGEVAGYPRILAEGQGQ